MENNSTEQTEPIEFNVDDYIDPSGRIIIKLNEPDKYVFLGTLKVKGDVNVDDDARRGSSRENGGIFHFIMDDSDLEFWKTRMGKELKVPAATKMRDDPDALGSFKHGGKAEYHWTDFLPSKRGPRGPREKVPTTVDGCLEAIRKLGLPPLEMAVMLAASFLATARKSGRDDRIREAMDQLNRAQKAIADDALSLLVAVPNE